MRKVAVWLLFACFVFAGASASQAANLHSRAGAKATVSEKYAPKFQALIDDLEAHGARIKFMGGIRPGYCGQASKHPCGMALDVCQWARGIVANGHSWHSKIDCNLPPPRIVSAIAAKHGLFSGGDWCDSDYGHFEAGGSWACHDSRRVVHHEDINHRHRIAGRSRGTSVRIEASAHARADWWAGVH